MSVHQEPNPDFEMTIRGLLEAMPAAAALGVGIDSLAPGTAVLTLPIRTEHTQHTGHVQAGIFGALADFAAGAAVATLLPVGWANVTLDYTVKIVAAAGGTNLRAEGSVVSAGKTVSVGRAEILDEDGRLCATALAAFRNVRVGP